MEPYGLQSDSPAWILFVQISWVAAVLAMGCGIYFLPTDLWVKGFMAMGVLYVMGSSFALAKTMRDRHETKRLIQRITDAKTEKIIKEFGDL